MIDPKLAEVWREYEKDETARVLAGHWDGHELQRLIDHLDAKGFAIVPRMAR